MELYENLRKLTGLEVYSASLSRSGGTVYFLCRRGLDKLVGAVGEAGIRGEKLAELEGKPVTIGPTDHANAAAIRAALPWTGPRRLGLATSAGLGDRLGLATPGHVRAIRGTGLAAVLAQQSIREMTRTARTPEEVMDCATWGVLQEGFRDGFGADADHLQRSEDIDRTAAAGFTFFTIDPGAHVDNEADTDSHTELGEKVARLDMNVLDTRAADLTTRYVGRTFDLDGAKISFDEETFLRAEAKYGKAIVHTVKMYRHLQDTVSGEFELEVSVDETDSPTSAAEHYLFASELKRLGVKWVSMAPRFIGRFEKGVDYIGDLDTFAGSFAEHVAVMKALGPYKISIHSGSDKFSIYPVIAELAGPYVHLKTAGTSYLEAVRVIGEIEPKLFREILEFAHARYADDKATYHVSADPAKVPRGGDLADAELAGVLDGFDGRQLLHVTFGSVLTAKDESGASLFRDRILAALKRDEEAHYAALEKHLGRHLAPFAKRV